MKDNLKNILWLQYVIVFSFWKNNNKENPKSMILSSSQLLFNLSTSGKKTLLFQKLKKIVTLSSAFKTTREILTKIHSLFHMCLRESDYVWPLPLISEANEVAPPAGKPNNRKVVYWLHGKPLTFMTQRRKKKSAKFYGITVYVFLQCLGREFQQCSNNSINKILVVENKYGSFSTIIPLHQNGIFFQPF